MFVACLHKMANVSGAAVVFYEEFAYNINSKIRRRCLYENKAGIGFAKL